MFSGFQDHGRTWAYRTPSLSLIIALRGGSYYYPHVNYGELRLEEVINYIMAHN